MGQNHKEVLLIALKQLRAVNLGGDADTIGAVVGTLAGAMYGYNDYIRTWYLKYVSKWDQMKCAIRAHKLFKMGEAMKDKA